jgi:hypothetical protein
MTVDDSTENDVRGFAAMINSRLLAEARVARAMSFAWVCTGGAIALALTGLGSAVAFSVIVTSMI